jgi:hypothetical protein
MNNNLKCINCKWYKNNEVLKKLYTQEKLAQYFKHSICGCGSDYYCVISGYSLFEERKSK